MKTLDEVIKAHEFCVNASITGAMCKECPVFAEPDCGVRDDALHYLKKYREKLDTESALPDYYELVDFWTEQQANPPLSWEQLKQMEGRPVWVEWTGIPRWGIVDGIFIDAYGVENLCVSVPHDYLHFDKRMQGQTWQAYRKERG